MPWCSRSRARQREGEIKKGTSALTMLLEFSSKYFISATMNWSSSTACQRKQCIAEHQVTLAWTRGGIWVNVIWMQVDDLMEKLMEVGLQRQRTSVQLRPGPGKMEESPGIVMRNLTSCIARRQPVAGMQHHSASLRYSHSQLKTMLSPPPPPPPTHTSPPCPELPPLTDSSSGPIKKEAPVPQEIEMHITVMSHSWCVYLAMSVFARQKYVCSRHYVLHQECALVQSDNAWNPVNATRLAIFWYFQKFDRLCQAGMCHLMSAS